MSLTEEVRDERGWLHTGDVGMIMKGNALVIVDRVKNIFKLSQGEYIVPEKLERIYEQSIYIQSIFIYGDSLQNNIVAIIYPEPEVVLNMVPGKQRMEEAVKDKRVKDVITEELSNLALKNKLTSLEKVNKNFRLVDKPFEVGTVLTPTLKLRRPKARDAYKHLIDEIYFH